MTAEDPEGGRPAPAPHAGGEVSLPWVQGSLRSARAHSRQQSQTQKPQTQATSLLPRRLWLQGLRGWNHRLNEARARGI